ncbi:hypothetical protein B1812_03130 [Methylocystis bryophila]|uniref:Uncharacterized protein n=1 Tax=Methylocystis bryophila TaxID=655015 RepID=A0A1W6MRM6_9HYPH|nr:hypothetical protein B1812_03130 [Methylocystis bryophila]
MRLSDLRRSDLAVAAGVRVMLGHSGFRQTDLRSGSLTIAPSHKAASVSNVRHVAGTLSPGCAILLVRQRARLSGAEPA